MIKFQDYEIFGMGTNIIQRIYSDNADEIARIAINEIKRLETLMSFFIPSSEVNRLNFAAGHDEILLSEDTYQVIKMAKEYSKLCDGAFDITMAPVIKLWGIFSKNERVPLKSEIDNTLCLPNYKDIILNEEKMSAKLFREGQMVDLGAIAKGYTADRIIEIYKQNRVKSGFVNLGGNVLTLGNKPDGSPWSIGLQNPFETRGNCLGSIEVSDETVVTSGDYVRYFEENKVKYHHILDPKTGYPADSGIISATVIGKNSMEADALSTAVFILGLEKGMELINKTKGVEVIFITSKKEIYITDGIRDRVTFVETDNEFSYA